MTSRAHLPPFRPTSGRIALAALALGGIFVLAGASAQVSSAFPQGFIGQVQPGQRVEFKTDECGDLSAIESSRSILSESGSIDESQGEDEGASTSAWGM